MAVGDVCRLMGNHALQLRSGGEFSDQAMVNKDRILRHNKRVQCTVIHHEDFHAIGAEPGGAQDRCGHLLEAVFDVGVPQQGDCACGQGHQDQKSRCQDQSGH